MTATKMLFTGLATATLFTASAHAVTITSVGSGDYQVGSTWDGATVPGPTDDAVITGGNVLTSSANIFVGNAFQGGGGTGSVTVENGSLTGGELGLAFFRTGATPSTASLNIGSAGSVTLNQVWVGAATGEAPANQNDVSINFTGDGGSLSVLTGFNSPAESGGTFRLTSNNVTAFSVVTFEDLWNQGFLTNDGESGLTGAIFSENFALSQVGDDVNDTITAIPEPSSLALLGLGGLMVARRRRK